MALDQKKEDKRVGINELNSLDNLKFKYLSAILKNKNRKAANTLAAYGNFLNKRGIKVQFFPLYMQIFATNSSYAVDALLDDLVPEQFLEFIEPNQKITESVFTILNESDPHEIYRQTMRVFCGYLGRMYESVDYGYSIFQPTIVEINNLAKNLDESRDQDEDLNRDILDILLFISDMDTHDQTDPVKQAVARQASSIRSDFFDNNRKLVNSVPSEILNKDSSKESPTTPEYVYID